MTTFRVKFTPACHMLGWITGLPPHCPFMSCPSESPICWEPAWGTPPMAKVMRKEAWHTQRRDQASGNPLFPSIYPQIRVLYPITISLGEGVNLQLQVNKNSWAWQECFNLRTLKVLWPAWSGLSGRTWLFTASQLWEAWDVLKLSKYRLFWEVRRSLV